VLRDAEQPAGGGPDGLPKLRDEPGSRPCSGSHQAGQARPIGADILRARAWARARLWRDCVLGLHEAVDVLQLAAVRSGLVKQLGQNAVQATITEAFARERNQDELIEVGPIWRQVARDAWLAPGWAEAIVAYHHDRRRGGAR
jgi:hypothetical protein